MNAEQKMQLLEELYADWANCARCPLAQPVGRHRNNVVFGEGNPDAKVLIVTGPPGEREDLSGNPCDGSSREVLDTLLESCQSTRDDVFIVPVLACRPTEHEYPDKNRKPTKQELAACRPRLDRVIEIVDPYVVLMLGTEALKALTPVTKNVSSIARKNPGPALEVTTQGAMIKLTRPGFATFHPQTLRRNWTLEPEGDVHMAYKAFQKAFQMADTYAELYHGITPPPRDTDD